MFALLYKNVRLLILTVCLILAWGLSAFWSLPRLEDPELSQRMALITTEFPGASAQRVETSVSQPLERAMFDISEIEHISTTSYVGYSTLWLELKDRVKNVDEVWSRVRDKLADVELQLPETAAKPEYHKLEPRSYTLIVALTWDERSPVNTAILSRLAKDLEERLRSLSGTETVAFYGLPQEEIQVEILPQELNSLGLTVTELARQIRQSDAKVPGGLLQSDRLHFPIEAASSLNSLERIRQIPICSGECSPSGQIVRLADVARVSKGERQPPHEVALISGKPAVVLSVLMESDRRIDRWVPSVRQTLEQFQEQLPKGISLQPIFDQSYYVRTRINSLFNDLCLGIVLVILSTTLLMGWRLGLILGAALPLSISIVFGMMSWLHIPLHQMSVTGLVIALGMGLDNAIVIMDEIERELELGIPPQTAISKTVRSLAFPLISSTLITIFSFLPIALLPGDTGEFVRDIAICVTLSLSSSIFLCLTVIPALAGRLRKKKSEFFDAELTSWYQSILDRVLARPWFGCLFCLGLSLTGFVLAFRLPAQFFPAAERDQFAIEFRLPSSTALRETKNAALEAREQILKHPEVAEVHWFVGKDAPAFYYNLPRRGLTEANFAHGFVRLKSGTDSRAIVQTLQQELDLTFPKSQILVRQLMQGPYITAPIEVYLYGFDLEILRQLGNEVRSQLAQMTSVTHTRAGLSETLPKVDLRLDEDRVRLAGFDRTQIARQIATSLEGYVGGSVQEGTEELPVRVRFTDGDRSKIESLESFELSNASEKRSLLPFSSIGKLALVPELAVLHRHNGRRVNTVLGFVRADVLPSTVKNELNQRLQASGFRLPAGYSLVYGGEHLKRTDALEHLLAPVTFLLVLAAVTLILPFNSFRLAAIVAAVGICSVGFSLIALSRFGYPLGFSAILGIVAMVGVEINDSMLVLTAIQANPYAYKGDRAAIRSVIVRSTRHVIATTITTVAGFMPLLLNGSEFWSPLALSIVSGVSGTTLLALFFAPCAYIILFRR
jgi:multidrug efflux pump subunit AcrB